MIVRDFDQKSKQEKIKDYPWVVNSANGQINSAFHFSHNLAISQNVLNYIFDVGGAILKRGENLKICLNNSIKHGYSQSKSIKTKGFDVRKWKVRRHLVICSHFLPCTRLVCYGPLGLNEKKEKKIEIRKRLNDKAFFNDSPRNKVNLSSALPLS